MLKNSKRGTRFYNRLTILTLTVLFSMVISSTAFGYYAYNYAETRTLNYADDNSGYAQQAFLDLGLTSGRYLGSSFTYSTFTNNLPIGNAIFVGTHGSPTLIADNYGNSISYASIRLFRNGDWKRFVYIDACDSGSTTLASSFGITNGDGDLHAYLGWGDLTYDSSTKSNFVYLFYYKLKNKNTINYSAWYASNSTGVSGYKILGNGNWSY